MRPKTSPSWFESHLVYSVHECNFTLGKVSILYFRNISAVGEIKAFRILIRPIKIN